MQRQRRIYLKLIVVLLLIISLVLPGSVEGNSYASTSLAIPSLQTENSSTNSIANTKIDPRNQEIIPEASSLTSSISEEITSNVIPLIDNNSSSKVIFPSITPESNVTKATYQDLNVEALRIPRPRTELTDKRDRFSKTFLNPDGTTTVQSAVYSLHYLDKGAWKEINTALRQDRSDGKNTYSMLANRFNVRLNNQSSKQAVTFSVSDQSVTYRALGMKNVTGAVYENTVIYNEAWKSTDLEYQVQNDQLKMELQLKDNNAPKTFSFQIDAQNVTYDLNPDGSIDFINQDGEVAFRIPRMWVKDSASDTLMYDRLKVSINQSKGKNVLSVTLDDTGLQYPVMIDPTTEIPIMSYEHWLYLKDDGTLWAWGSNYMGQLGNGSFNSSKIPIQVLGLENVLSVFTGADNSFAVKRDGTLWAWGGNTGGSLGIGNTNIQSVPVQVTGMTNVKAISAANNYTLALKEDGTVWAWGRNSNGQLGNGTGINSLTPVQTSINNVKKIVASSNSSLALKEDGTVWAWGNYKTLGNNYSLNNSSPLPLQIESLSNIKDIAVGYDFAVALHQDGRISTWGGRNKEGQLGFYGGINGDQISWTPLIVNGISNVTGISVGDSFVVALKEDGTAWAWGDNYFGQLGNGTTTSSSSPVQVSGLTNIGHIQSNSTSNLAVLEDYSMWIWGRYINGYSILPVPYFLPMPDTIPPSAPSGFQLDSATKTTVQFKWLPSTDNMAVQAYDIYIEDQLMKSVGVTSCMISGLMENTLYKFTIKARDAAGNVSEGTHFYASTDGIWPTAPTDIKINNTTSTSISLSWSASTDNIGIKNYQIEVKDFVTENTVGTWSTENGITTTYNVTPLAPNKTYSIVVTAYDISGHGNPSNAILGRTGIADIGPPTAPTSLIATERISTAIFLSWTASEDDTGIVAYDIYHNTTLLASQLGNYTRYVLDPRALSYDLKTTFNLTVRARDIAGNVSEPSNILSVNTDLSPPSAPSDLILDNRTPSSIKLRWSSSYDYFGVTYYDIYNNETTLLASVNATNYTLDNYDPNVDYSFTVRARDFAGNVSDASPSVVVISDVLPPTPPTNLVVLNRSPYSIQLSWSPSTDNIAITNYEIYNGATRINVIGNSTSTTVGGLKENEIYAFSIKARDSAGNISESSNIVTVSTDFTPPATPTALKALTWAGTTISLSWNASTDNLGVIGYEIYSSGSLIATSSGTGTSYTLSGMVANKPYTISIKAKDAAGNLSSASNTITVTVDGGIPTTPGALKVTSRTESSISLSWTGSTDNIGIAGYEVYNGSTLLTTSVGTATTFTLTGLNANTAYSLSIKAKDAAGNISTASNVVLTGTDLTPPTAPTALKVISWAATSISISWTGSTDNVGVTGYAIYSGSELIAFSNGSGTSYIITGLPKDTSYSLTVKAKDASENISPSSNSLTVSTDGTAPTAPQITLAYPDNESTIVLSFKPSKDNIGVIGYDIFNGSTLLKTISGTSVNTIFTTLTGLSTNTVYNLSIKAKDAAGNVSISSNVYTVGTDKSNPTAPSDLKMVSRTESSITLSWIASSDNVGIAGYKIYSEDSLLATSVGTETSYTLTGLPFNTVYTITIVAYDPSGNVSKSSNKLTVGTDLTPPTAPTELVAQFTNQSSLILSWKASSDNVAVLGYEIYQEGRLLKTINAVSGNSAYSATISGMPSSDRYIFTVKAKDTAGNLSISSEIQVTPKLEYFYTSGRLSHARAIPFGHVIDYRYDKNGNLLKKIFTNSLVEDNSFEKGNSKWSWDSTNKAFAIISSKATEGSSSLMFSSSKALNKNSEVWYTNYIEVSPNTSYTLSAMMQDNLSSGSYYVKVLEFTATSSSSQDFGIQLSSTRRGQQVWDQPSIQFTTNASTARVRIQIIADSNAVGEAYIDQIVLQ